MRSLLVTIARVTCLKTLVLRSRSLQSLSKIVLDRWAWYLEVPKYGFTLRIHSLSPVWLESDSTHGYEPLVSTVCTELLKPGSVMVDVGANEGYFSLLSSKYVGSTGRVLAIEPAPAAVRTLQENIALNSASNITVAPCCLSDSIGEADFFVSKISGLSSLSSTTIHGAHTTIRVPITTLEHIAQTHTLDHIDLLKIDTQGKEFACLRGLTNLAPKIEHIIIEFWPQGLRDAGEDPLAFLHYLTHIGYSFRGIEIPAIDSATMNNDHILRMVEDPTRKTYIGYTNLIASRMS